MVPNRCCERPARCFHLGRACRAKTGRLDLDMRLHGMPEPSPGAPALEPMLLGLSQTTEENQRSSSW